MKQVGQIKLESGDEWIRIQEYQRQQEEMRKQQEKDDEMRKKQMYRDELQKLIDEQRFTKNQEKNIDIEMLQRMEEQNRMSQQADFKKNIDSKLRAKEFVGVSLDLERERKQKQMEIKQFDQEQQRLIAQKLYDQEQADKYNRLAKKNMVQQDLQQAYNDQEYRNKLDLERKKQQERDIHDQEYRKLLEQEQKRNEFMERLKSGYNQNNQVLHKFQQIHQEQERQQQDFQRRFVDQAIEERKWRDEINAQLTQQAKQKLKDDTLQTVLGQMNQKQQMNQILQEQKKNELYVIQHQQWEQQRKELQNKEEQKKKKQDYQNELLKQIESDKHKKANDGKMNIIEQNMNRLYLNNTRDSNSYQQVTSSQPGLSYGQIESQMNNYQIDNRNSSLRQRNISAYQAGNNIINQNQVQYSPDMYRKQPMYE